MDETLRNSLWNLVLSIFRTDSRLSNRSTWEIVTRRLAAGFFKVPVDHVPTWGYSKSLKWLHSAFDQLPWYEVYNLLEFLVHEVVHPSLGHNPQRIVETSNAILEAEMSAFRFIEGELVPISNPTEVHAIEQAVDDASRAGLDGVRIHLEAALSLLARKPTPDYRNSIKESISAVEAAAKAISGSEKGELKDALAALEGKVALHGALKKGFLSIYGYTSDADGIRHALMDEPTAGFDEAKFMLVSCSAFTSFLISKAASAKVLKLRR